MAKSPAARDRTRVGVQPVAAMPHRPVAPPAAARRAAQPLPGRSSAAYAFGRVRVDADPVSLPRATPIGQLLHRAAAEPALALADRVRRPLEARLGAGLGAVRVHDGAWSAQAADRIGARAFTFGRDVYLGSEGRALGGAQRDRLLAHEAVHALQQGAAPALGDTVRVGGAHEPAEAQAHALADAAFGSSRSLALRDGLRRDAGATSVVKLAPAIQRDLKGSTRPPKAISSSTSRTSRIRAAINGMSGTIAFHAARQGTGLDQHSAAPGRAHEDLDTGHDYVWTGGEANRNKMITPDDPGRGVSPGYFVDHLGAAATPRTAKTDPDVSPYYRDYAPNAAESHDGSKAGTTVVDASLWDYPGWHGKLPLLVRDRGESGRHRSHLRQHHVGLHDQRPGQGHDQRRVRHRPRRHDAPVRRGGEQVQRVLQEQGRVDRAVTDGNVPNGDDDADVRALVAALDDGASPAHLDVTPAVTALAALGRRAVPALLGALASESEMTRLHAQRALEGILEREHGFVPGRGFPTPADEEALRAEWRANGSYDYAAEPAARAAAIALWRRRLAQDG